MTRMTLGFWFEHRNGDVGKAQKKQLGNKIQNLSLDALSLRCW